MKVGGFQDRFRGGLGCEWLISRCFGTNIHQFKHKYHHIFEGQSSTVSNRGSTTIQIWDRIQRSSGFVVGWTQFGTLIEVNASYSNVLCHVQRFIDLWGAIVVVSTRSPEPWIFKVKFPVTTAGIGRSSSTQHPQKIKSMENRKKSATSFQEFILAQILLKLGALAQKVLIYQQFLVFL